MPAVTRQRAIKREQSAERCIPYTAQVAEHVVRLDSGDYVQVFRLGGASFESADDSELNNWHERLNVLWRNLASPNVAIWTHLIRRRETGTGLAFVTAEAVASVPFADTLAAKYRQRLAGETLMVKLFGSEAIEYRTPTETRVGRCLASRNIPRPSVVGMYNPSALGAIPEFVLTQSFTFLDQGDGSGAVATPVQPHGQRRRLRRLSGRGAQGCARCAHEQRVRHGRSPLHAAGALTGATGRKHRRPTRLGGSRRLNDTSRWPAACSPTPA
jgi:hypothetical protein